MLETIGAAGRNRTADLRITNALLYQLSYSGDERRIIQAVLAMSKYDASCNLPSGKKGNSNGHWIAPFAEQRWNSEIKRRLNGTSGRMFFPSCARSFFKIIRLSFSDAIQKWSRLECKHYIDEVPMKRLDGFEKCRVSGFSLLELMVVVAIVAILASVAYPSYTEYVQRSRIAEATANLSDIRIRMERYYQDNRTYISTALGGNACGAAMPPDDSFHYTCVANTADTFLATATGVAGGMNAFAFDVNHNNLRRTTSFPGVTGTQDCWMTRRGDSC